MHVTIGDKDYIQRRAPIPTPEELAQLAENVRCAVADMEGARAVHRAAREALAKADADLEEAQRRLSVARALLRARAEGYELVSQDEATTEAIAKQTGGIAFDEIKRVAAGLARVEPGPDAEYFAVMRSDWTTTTEPTPRIFGTDPEGS